MQWKLCFPAPVFAYNLEFSFTHIWSTKKRLEVAYILARFTLQIIQ